MAQIPGMTLDAAKTALDDQFQRDINTDIKYNKCIWCKSGQVKKKNHALIDCHNARPSLDDRTPLSNDVFNAGQQDAAVAYIHYAQLRQHPRANGATTFMAGLPPAQMGAYVVPVPAAPTALLAPVPVASAPVLAPVPVTSTSTQPPVANASTPTSVVFTPPPSTQTTGAAQSSGVGEDIVDPTSRTSTQAGNPSAVLTVPIQDSPGVSWTPVNYELAEKAPEETAYSAGNKYDPGSNSLARLSGLKGKMKHPVRDAFRDDKKNSVLTNHFEVDIDTNAKFYEYRITGIPDNEKRATRRRVMKTVMENVPFLKNNQDSFATNYVDTIIAWKDIHSLVTTPKIASHDPNAPHTKDEWRILEVVDRNVTLSLNIRFMGLVDIAAFQSYIASSHPDPPAYDPEPVKNALNIIFAKCFDNVGETLQLNGHKFFVSHALNDLKANKDIEYPLRALRGYYYTIKAGMGKILLNVNPANSAFWNPYVVSEILLRGLATFGSDAYALKGLQVYITYNRGRIDKAQASDINAGYNRTKKIRAFGKRIDKQRFVLHEKDAQGNLTGNSKSVTVADYLEQTYHMKLKHKDLLAVDLSSTGEPSWFAPEHLVIPVDQIWARIIPDAVANQFHKLACLSPRQNRARIEYEGLAQLARDVSALPPDSDLHAQLAPLIKCPLIKINPTMLQIPAARLPYASIKYGNNNSAKWKNGRWNLEQQKFVRGSRNGIKWKLLLAPKVTDEASNKFMEHFKQQLIATGVCPANTATHIDPNALRLNAVTEVELRNKLQGLYEDKQKAGVPDIVVLMLPSKDQQVYSHFKYLADKIFCFQAICATEQNFQPKPKDGGWNNDKSMEQYMANVAMKANLKVQGINHNVVGVNQWFENTLVLGADITHPGSGAIETCPSIAAVVGSVESNAGRFRGVLHLQDNVDMIEHFEAAVKDLLNAWWDEHQEFPKNVLYYRDGVSKSQYAELETTEIPAIQRAFTNYAAEYDVPAPSFNLTTVIVTKRHNTRLFPARAEDAMYKNENCFPGTLVDSAITDPYFSDFFLQTHNAIKGTARPCHYYVLNNGMNLSMKELQDFTHRLCHTYVRATMGVSYAPPAYYADRLCERGRCYMRPWYNPTTDTKKYWGKLKRQIEDDVKAERDKTNKKANRPQRTRGHKKTAEEVKEQDADQEEVRKRLNKKLKEEYEDRFNKECIGGEDRAREFLDTMYWM
ncbi:uncharacterized protein J4E78_001324 [Alternaria triticimaculans]|uniref:uncharacterized protein n=1 Tax=Alternaria triticimaculans TaxID=297637 RepID=UPI0020C53A24|nr:uncharacterized protein J4E78_001324 [Alternaria triticimaculans]KAI4672821.1 hypothetical protein J4E78_001324 [Alternaria triticimaculans]